MLEEVDGKSCILLQNASEGHPLDGSAMVIKKEPQMQEGPVQCMDLLDVDDKTNPKFSINAMQKNRNFEVTPI